MDLVFSIYVIGNHFISLTLHYMGVILTTPNTANKKQIPWVYRFSALESSADNCSSISRDPHGSRDGAFALEELTAITYQRKQEKNSI